MAKARKADPECQGMAVPWGTNGHSPYSLQPVYEETSFGLQ